MRFLFLIAFVLSLFVAGSLATCGNCCSTGTCNAAFRGSDGICCGVRAVDDAFSKPYCCPSNAKCIDDNFGGFKCQLMNAEHAAAIRNLGTPTTTSSGLRWWQWILSVLGGLALLGLVGWGIYRLVDYCRYGNNKVVIGHNHNHAARGVEVRL